MINATRTKHSKSKGNTIWFRAPFGFQKFQDVGPRPRSEQRWNDAFTEYCWIACLHEIFELNVCRECSNWMFALNVRIACQDWMFQLNTCTKCFNWMFIFNVWIECLHWMLELNVYMENRNWTFESNSECPTCKCNWYILIPKMEVSLKDEKVELKTR